MTASVAKSERERSRIELGRAYISQTVAKANMDATEAKLKTLRRKRNKLRQVTETADVKAEQAFQDYARTVCQEFYNSVHATLPREVRDMIYGYLYETRPHQVTLSYFATSVVPESYCAPAHMWKSEIVGQTLHREFCEHFFRSNSFEFHNNLARLPEFRAVDQWSIGHPPAVFPTNILIEIHEQDYDFSETKIMYRHMGKHGDNDGWGGSPCWLESNLGSRSGLISELEMLFGFAAGTKITIQIYTLPNDGSGELDEQEQTCEKVVPLVLPILDRLQATGYKTTFVVAVSDLCWGRYSDNFVVEGSFTLQECRNAFKKHRACVMAKGLKADSEAADGASESDGSYREDETEDDEDDNEYDDDDDEEEE